MFLIFCCKFYNHINDNTYCYMMIAIAALSFDVIRKSLLVYIISIWTLPLLFYLVGYIYRFYCSVTVIFYRSATVFSGFGPVNMTTKVILIFCFVEQLLNKNIFKQKRWLFLKNLKYSEYATYAFNIKIIFISYLR